MFSFLIVLFINGGGKQTRSLLGDLNGATDPNYTGSIALALGCIHRRSFIIYYNTSIKAILLFSWNSSLKYRESTFDQFSFKSITTIVLFLNALCLIKDD